MVRYTKRDSKKILKQVARLRGISVSEVREELEIAIEEARNNPDPDAQAEFHRLFGNKTPTPEEFLCISTKNFRPQKWRTGYEEIRRRTEHLPIYLFCL